MTLSDELRFLANHTPDGIGVDADNDGIILKAADRIDALEKRVDELELHVECLKQCVRGDHGAMMPSGKDERGLPVPPWKCEECGWVEDDRDFV